MNNSFIATQRYQHESFDLVGAFTTVLDHDRIRAIERHIHSGSTSEIFPPEEVALVYGMLGTLHFLYFTIE
jgi:hypothetical protein